jgi:hypothetical protein
MLVNQQHDGKIVGLHASSNGRSCMRHGCCGHQVHPRMFVRFKVVVMDVVYQNDDDGEDSRLKQVVKAVLISNGTEMCTVGFLLRAMASRPRDVARCRDKFAQILQFYDDTPPDRVRHNKSKRNHGIASFILLDSIPLFE